MIADMALLARTRFLVILTVFACLGFLMMTARSCFASFLASYRRPYGTTSLVHRLAIVSYNKQKDK